MPESATEYYRRVVHEPYLRAVPELIEGWSLKIIEGNEKLTTDPPSEVTPEQNRIALNLSNKISLIPVAEALEATDKTRTREGGL